MGGEARDAEQAAKLRHKEKLIDGASPFEILGVSPTANDAEIRRSFLAATKQWHPARFARCSPEIVRNANDVFVELKKAYESVRTEEGRRKVLKRLGLIVESSSSSEWGGGASQVTSIGKVERGFQQKSISETSPRFSFEEKQMMTDAFGNAKEHLRNKRWSKAREVFQMLANRMPEDRSLRALMFASHGFELVEQGEGKRAKVEFQKALKLNPNLKLAIRGASKADQVIAMNNKKGSARG